METSFFWFGVFSGSFGVQSIVLCKCSGKYIDIYFILKITCFYIAISTSVLPPILFSNAVFNSVSVKCIFCLIYIKTRTLDNWVIIEYHFCILIL